MKTRKLLSLLLALLMALSLAVPAFADESDPPEKELRFAWIFNDEEGKWFAEDTVVNGKDMRFEGGLGMNPAGDPYMIFFIWNNEKGEREKFVVPEGDGNITVTKLPAGEIAGNAKESQYYVRLHMDEFKDGEVTAEGLSFHVNAMLDELGFYSAETASVESLLPGEVAAADLTDYTLYFHDIYMGTDEADQHDAVTKVEKDPNLDDGPNKFYDLENVKDGVWKLTINDTGKVALKNGGFPINLNLEVKNPQGETREGWRNIFIQGEEQAPQLFFAYLSGEWDEAAEQDIFYVDREHGGAGDRVQLRVGEENFGIFGIVKDGENPYDENGRFNWGAFTPLDVKDLELPSGITVESASDRAKKGENWARYFVRLTVAENEKEYTISSGDHVFTVDSGLPEIGVYSTDTASFDNWCGWKFPYHPAYADKTYYIISTATDDGFSNRHLTDAKLSAANEENATSAVNLEKVSDNVYKLTLKKDAKDERDWFRVELDLTWTDFMGNTYTDTRCYAGDFERQNAVVASSTALTDGTLEEPELLEYSTVADKVSNEISLTVGEQKDMYLYLSRFFGPNNEQPSWKVWALPQHGVYHTSDTALTITADENDFAKVTLSASKSGTYEIIMGNVAWDYENLKLFHADGKAYTSAEMEKFHRDVSYFVNGDGVFYVVQDDNKEVPFTEAYPGETYEIENLGWQENTFFRRVTVTVTGEAKTFPDVKDSDWFAKAVQYVCGRGLMTGTDKGFEPLRNVYNTELIQILWNMSGNPEVDTTVAGAAGQWYAGAVNWAASVNLIDGAAFSGQEYINRGVVREMMDAYGKLVSKDYSNLFKGNESGDLMLDKALSRSELAQVLMNAQA